MQIVQKARAAPGPWDTKQPTIYAIWICFESLQASMLGGGKKIRRKIHAELREPLETKNKVM